MNEPQDSIFKGLFTSPRAKWDSYFISMAVSAGSNSKCLSRQIGAVLVREKSVVSTGYNGPARGVPHCTNRQDIRELAGQGYIITCPRQLLGYKTGEGLEHCLAVHAEVNTIANAARNGVSTLNCSLYLSGGIMPCVHCMSAIINAGIVEVVVAELIPYDNASRYIIEHSKVKVRDYKGNTWKEPRT